ncbi:MAG TPA: Gfo/Idh/MocA family oxidoreductase [Verrucomicrobiae bacterium]|jgi:predicted dehydrogenase|nr:Gfo/Idh/MocA family oxidoreductase [Verrucomicrobiae bacterium]
MAVKRINVAVAGAGFMGVTHLRAYQQIPHARIVAVCDRSRSLENGVLRGVVGNIQNAAPVRLPGVKMVRDFAELLADPGIDVIDICTPTALHPAQAVAALEAGKHVLCEKPVGVTSAEARAIARAAGKARGLLMPAMCMRFWPGWSWLKEVAASETYGRILAAQFCRLSARPAWGNAASHPGGAHLDLHIHDTDFVSFLFGRPSQVFTRGVCGADGSLDHVVTQYIYPAGPVVQAEGSWLQAAGFNMSFLVHCERATLDFDLQRGAGALRVVLPGKESKTVKLRGPDGYHAEIRHFIDCVRQKKTSPIVTAQDAVATLEICEAEEKSARSGAVVRVR